MLLQFRVECSSSAAVAPHTCSILRLGGLRIPTYPLAAAGRVALIATQLTLTEGIFLQYGLLVAFLAKAAIAIWKDVSPLSSAVVALVANAAMASWKDVSPLWSVVALVATVMH